MMRKSIATLCVAALGTLALSAFGARAQAPDSTWIIQFDYMKSQSADYAALETETWKKIHEKRIEQGSLWSWALWSVNFGFDGSYDYVTVNVWRTWDSYENTWGDNFTKAVEATQLDKPWEEISATTGDARTLVKSELWGPVDFTGNGTDVKYMTVAYMNVPPGGGGAYTHLESDIWKPMHEQRIADGDLKAWGVLSLQSPGGTEYPYDHAAFNMYESLAQMNGGARTFAEIVQAVHPQLTVEQIGEMTRAARDGARGELWQRLDGVSADQ